MHHAKGLVRTILALAALFLLTAPALAAGGRYALVIGNSAYKEKPLKNPANDARDIASTLRELGFEVILRENAGLTQMEQAVDLFWASLKKGGTGLFFFAGHGMQVKGVNYLVPVDANIQLEQDVKIRCLDVNLVLGRMENAGNPLNLVILDACRNNPFARAWRNAGQGLAKMDAPMGTLIAYATAPDSVAADGAGRNGVYTQHLLQLMRAPGLTIENVLKQTRIGVIRDTDKRQIPWESSSLTGEFYFKPGVAGQTQPSELLALGATPKGAPKPVAPEPSVEHKVGDSWTDPATGMEFLWVPGGTYVMGCGPWSDSCDSMNAPAHSVQLSGFWIGKYEVTQGQWQKVMGSNPSKFKKGDNYPVEMVSWGDAKGFGAKMSSLGLFKFRLPTEAEWEYAARSGGREEEFAGSEEVDLVAWYEDNSGGSSHAVGTKAPNGLGLYDMSGNIGEWIEDVFRYYTASPQENPVFRKGASATVAGTDIPARLDRGGSWLSRPGGSTTYFRGPGGPAPYSHTGLRLVRVP